MMGLEYVQAMPSRFLSEMKLCEVGPREDPREKLKRLREEMAAKAAATRAAAQNQQA
jgi:ATP-dependent DNA helicase Rep